MVWLKYGQSRLGLQGGVLQGVQELVELVWVRNGQGLFQLKLKEEYMTLHGRLQDYSLPHSSEVKSHLKFIWAWHRFCWPSSHWLPKLPNTWVAVDWSTEIGSIRFLSSILLLFLRALSVRISSIWERSCKDNDDTCAIFVVPRRENQEILSWGRMSSQLLVLS